MRRILLPGLALGFAATACAAATRPYAPAQPRTRAAQSEQGAIVIREQSNVCVWVHVDQRIWPIPLGENADWNFSGLLAFELGRAYQRRGGTLVLPRPGNEPRFVANAGNVNPACHAGENDVHVALRYMPRADGGAFAAEYRIEQGGVARTGSFARDLAAEERAGRIRSPHPGPIAPYAISMDIRARAPLIIGQMR